MRFKNFSQFVNEGARWNDDKTGVLISFKDRPNDILSTRVGQSTAKTGGFGKYIFKVFYGLESEMSEKDIRRKGTELEVDYANLMKRLKQGYFNMVADNEPDYKMSLRDIAKGAQEDLTEYDQKLFFEFMKKTGNIDVQNLKYIVKAESQDIMTRWMAETLAKYTKAEIVELPKNRYSNDEILRIYRKIPKVSVPPMNRYGLVNLTKFQQEIVKDYEDYISTREELKKKRESGELDTLEKFLKAIDKAESGAQFLQGVYDLMANGEVVIKGDALFNRLRGYLNFKYNFSEDFIDKVRECLQYGSTAKMIIIDDNLQHGADFREIMKMCGYIADTLMVAGKTSAEAVKNTENARKKLYAAMNAAQKKSLAELYRQAQILERCNIDNVSGYVLYKRPVITASELPDVRYPYPDKKPIKK